MKSRLWQRQAGSSRLVQPSSVGRNANLADFNSRMASGLYNVGNSSISSVSGAYVAYMNGHNYYTEEMEAARILSDAGFNVVLTPEGDGFEIYATNIKKGKHKYSEGTVSQITYEQSTPKSIKEEAKITVKNAIVHANDKHSDIALIYDKYNLFHRNDIEEGMKHYQKTNPGWQHKAKVVLVVNSKGEVWEHQFNK